MVYSSIEYTSLAMHTLGPGAQLGNIDIRDAYRIIPVHHEEWPFLALSWQDRVYVDCQLPFGLASAPAILVQLWRPWNGSYAGGGSAGCYTIWMTSCSWGHQALMSVSLCWRLLFRHARSLEFLWSWARSKAQQSASLSLALAYVLAPCQRCSKVGRSRIVA